MPDIKILFLHGLEGNPEGSKPTFLKQEGYRVIAPSLPKNDWELSVARAEDYFINFRPDVIVGSSRGGAVAVSFPTGDVPKILVAPAWEKFKVYPLHVDETTTILHCADDKLVTFESSCTLRDSMGCRLIECGENHRMSDAAALDALHAVVKVVT